MPLLRRLRSARAWTLVAALSVTGVVGVCAREGDAAAGTSSSKKTSSSSKKKSTKKSGKSGKSEPKAETKEPTPNEPEEPTADAPAVEQVVTPSPQVRPTDTPASVSDLWRWAGGFPGYQPGEVGDDLPPEDDLDAIAAQYKIDIATGKVPLGEDEDEDEEADAEEEPPSAPDPADDEPKWIKHTIVPYDTIGEIADRYGVSVKSLIRWNKLNPKKIYLRAGKTLKVRAVRPPPPQEKIEYEIQRGDSWEKVAEAHGVDVKRLRKWNKPKKDKNGKPKPVMVAGKTLTIWVEPGVLSGEAAAGGGAGAPAGKGDDAGARRVAAKVRRNALSIGTPTKGRLFNGVSFPEAPDLYELRKPAQAYGSSHTIKTAIMAISEFRRRSKYKRELVIGAVSLPRGGRFRPHRSHQSGRDIDIRLPVRASVDHHKPPRANEVDWRAAYRLIKAFADTGEVQYIFLEHRLQKVLYRAAQASGASKQELAALIQWPRPAKTNNGVVRHAAGHTSHIHIRIKCGPRESKCREGR
ncbi:MAG: penicillin-insensitive murein endopeptidase [Myxococcales bacterium]|nr:penicillin-insensitive murein endopeptidase [Myxococcales bacterium]